MKYDFLIVGVGFADAVSAVKAARRALEKNGITLGWKVSGLRGPSKQYDTPFEFVGPLYNVGEADRYSGRYHARVRSRVLL